MKTLYLIGGPMGVGKTAVCQKLKENLPNAVFLDGDWCWNANPFQVTEETKKMVLENISFLLNQFLQCSAYENVIFCWVMHEQSIVEAILNRLELSDCRVESISLVCTPEALRARLQRDIDAGVRDESVIVRSLERLSHFGALSTRKLDTTGMTVSETAERLVKKSVPYST